MTRNRRPARDRRATGPAETGAGSRWPAPRGSRTTFWPRVGERPARSSRTSLPGGGLLDRGADTCVGAAAADVAVHRLVDLLVGRLRRALEQRLRGHDLAGLTVAALRDTDLDPCRLQRASDGIAADRFDGHHLAIGHHREGRDAGAHRLPVDVHGAGATEGHAAAELATGEPELVSQRPQQRSVAGHVDILAFAVDVECDHRALLLRR